METAAIMMVVISFLGPKGMEAALQRVARLLERYAAAREIETGVVA